MRLNISAWAIRKPVPSILLFVEAPFEPTTLGLNLPLFGLSKL